MSDISIPLREVRVRPVQPEEEPQWNALLRAHHYLGFRKLCGAQLKQVAVWGDRWLALLGWQEAALHCGPRDRWLGWTTWQRRARLHLVANQSRFLLLPSAGRTPRLASRVLGLSLRRLAADWRARSGRPLLLVETFVDPARFAGTCYRAANWLPLGHTQGFGRKRGHTLSYVAHGQPKVVWVYPLHRRARAWLAAPATPAAWTDQRNRIAMTPSQLEALWLHLRRVPDFRSRQGQRHPLPTVLAIVLASRLGGTKTPKESAEFAARLPLEHLQRLGARSLAGTYRAPSYNTIRRVLQGVDPVRLEAECDAWMATQGAARDPSEALARDGRAMRGSSDHDLQEDGTEATEAP